MSSFVWQFWRFGWARDDYTEMTGWARIAGRLWRRI